MSAHGRLTKGQLPYTMPATSPLYPFPPMKLPNTHALTVTFLTDADAALEVLPEPLELREPASASVGVYWVPDSDIGGYYEALYVVNASYKDQPIRYDVFSVLTGDQAMAFGREVMGVPKKIGHLTLERKGNHVTGRAERPLGQALLTVEMDLEEQLDTSAGTAPGESAVSLRILSHPDPDGGPGEIEAALVESPVTWSLLEQWKGVGTVSFGSSATDNWQLLPVKEVTGFAYSRFDLEIPVPKLMARM